MGVKITEHNYHTGLAKKKIFSHFVVSVLLECFAEHFVINLSECVKVDQDVNVMSLLEISLSKPVLEGRLILFFTLASSIKLSGVCGFDVTGL